MTFDLQLSVSKNAILDKLWKMARENSLGETSEAVNTTFKKIIVGKICFAVEEGNFFVYGKLFPKNRVILLRKSGKNNWTIEDTFKTKFSFRLLEIVDNPTHLSTTAVEVENLLIKNATQLWNQIDAWI